MSTTQKIVFKQGKNKVIKQGNHFFTRVFENGEYLESGDFNTLERAKKSLGIETSKTYTQANRGANIALILAFILFTLLGVLIGVLFNPAIVKFIIPIINYIKSLT